jgi:hypothetical protein
VLTFEADDARGHVVGAAFRRDDLLFVVLGTGDDPAETEALVAAAAVQHLDLAPPGSTSIARLPSATRSIVQSMVLVALAAVALLGLRALRTLGRRRRAVGVVRPPMSVPTIDVAPEAARRRRGALGIAAVQIVAWTVAIVVIAADLPNWLRVLVVLLAVGGGWWLTARWRRRDLGQTDGAGRVRLARPAPAEIALLLGGIALLVIGIALVIWGLRERLFLPSLTHLELADAVRVEPGLLALLMIMVGIGVVLAGTAVLRLGRSRSRATAAELRALDPRPPVLYLRSFADDDVRLPTVLSPRRPFIEMFSLRTADPFEESLAWELGSYGPVVAVGRPGAALDSLGAAREYLPDATWQTGVRERMAMARAIVVVAGDTPGLEWEIAAIADGGHLAKTIFVVPPVAEADAWQRWTATCASLPDPVRVSFGGVDPVAALTVQLTASGPLVTVGHRNDEADYRVAVDRSMAGIAGGRSSQPRTLTAGRPALWAPAP